MISDSLADGQFFPKLFASVWSGTFWPHRRTNGEGVSGEGKGDINSCSASMILQGQSLGFYKLFSPGWHQRKTLSKAVDDPHTSSSLPEAIRETLKLRKNSVSPAPPSFSTQLLPSALLSILWGHHWDIMNQGASPGPSAHISPLPQQRPPLSAARAPPPAEMEISRTVAQKVRASTPSWQQFRG